MAYKINIVVLLLAFVFISFTAHAQNEILTNEDIVDLTKARFTPSLIVQKIRASKCDFDTTSHTLVQLKSAGVVESVISEMIRTKLPTQVPVVVADTRPVAVTETRPVVIANPKPAAVAPKAAEDSDPKPVVVGNATKGTLANGRAKPAQSTAASMIKSDTNDFPEATKVVSDQVKNMVGFIQSNLDGGESIDEAIANDFVELFSFAAALGIEKETNKKEAIFSLTPISYAFETARTDKQIGVSSSSTASTSQIDKPGVPRLLGFAIENGFVEKNVRDSVLSLSTTLAAPFTIGAKDYQTAYQNAGVFNKIGVSASFNINDQNSLLANATRGQLREFSIRYNFFDRSARSPEFQTIFNRDIAPLIKRQLDAVGAIKEFVDVNVTLRKLRNDSEPKLKSAVKELTDSSEFKALAKEKQAEKLTNLILNFMKAEVYVQMQNDTTTIPDADKTVLRGKLNNLLKVQKETIFTEARKHLDEFYKKSLGTLAYINHRDPLGNYSEFKFMYERHSTMLKPLALTVNSGFSLYHNPNRVLNQQKIRDMVAAVSLEGRFESPWLEIEDMTPITYSFTGRYARMYENKGVLDRKADLGSFQFLLNLPVYKGFGLPLSVTYSNATEMDRRSGVRFNFGIKLDTDKLFELAKLSHLLQQ